MPLPCSVTTRVAGPTNGTIATLALSVSLALTAQRPRRRQSQYPRAFPVALTWRRIISPERALHPQARAAALASRWAPRDEDDVFAGLGEPRARPDSQFDTCLEPIIAIRKAVSSGVKSALGGLGNSGLHRVPARSIAHAFAQRQFGPAHLARP